MYKPYYEWECFLAGMYDPVREKSVVECLVFMSNVDFFARAMYDVSIMWPVTMEDKLTNTSLNRVAFIGQAACCYAKGFRCGEVKAAWKDLDAEYKLRANEEARKVIRLWEMKYTNGLKNIAKPGRIDVIRKEYLTLFPLD